LGLFPAFEPARSPLSRYRPVFETGASTFSISPGTLLPFVPPAKDSKSRICPRNQIVGLHLAPFHLLPTSLTRHRNRNSGPKSITRSCFFRWQKPVLGVTRILRLLTRHTHFAENPVALVFNRIVPGWMLEMSSSVQDPFSLRCPAAVLGEPPRPLPRSF